MADDSGVWAKIVPTDFNLGGGKVLQVNRAYSTVEQQTASTGKISTGLRVRITPKFADSDIYLFATARANAKGMTASAGIVAVRLSIHRESDGSAVFGAEDAYSGHHDLNVIDNSNNFYSHITLIGHDDAGSTDERWYETKFSRAGSTGLAVLENDKHSSQLIAIEVAK